MIMKFRKNDDTGKIELQSHVMVDISDDPRTKMLSGSLLTLKKYKVEKRVYFVKQNFFVHMANIGDRPDATCLYMKYKTNQIVIIGDNSHVFYNGMSIDPKEFKLPFSETTICNMFKKESN
jgi:hypothetical protein